MNTKEKSQRLENKVIQIAVSSTVEGVGSYQGRNFEICFSMLFVWFELTNALM